MHVTVARLEGERRGAGTLGVDDRDCGDRRARAAARPRGTTARPVHSGSLPRDRVERQPQADRARAAGEHEAAAAEAPLRAGPLPVGRRAAAPSRSARFTPRSSCCDVDVGPSASSARAAAPSRVCGARRRGRRAGPRTPEAAARRGCRARAVTAAGERLGARRRRPGRHPGPTGRRTAPGRVHSGSPSARHWSAMFQRGQRLAGVPLALAAVDHAASGVRRAQPLGEALGELALVARRRHPCSTAALVASSSATKVGSPPMVSRTSPACRRSSTASPSASMRGPLLVGVGLRSCAGPRGCGRTSLRNSNVDLDRLGGALDRAQRCSGAGWR